MRISNGTFVEFNVFRGERAASVATNARQRFEWAFVALFDQDIQTHVTKLAQLEKALDKERISRNRSIEAFRALMSSFDDSPIFVTISLILMFKRGKVDSYRKPLDAGLAIRKAVFDRIRKACFQAADPGN
ncbi:hypothetical protein Tco_0797701 [Tanacetum coccineum]